VRDSEGHVVLPLGAVLRPSAHGRARFSNVDMSGAA
jgi:hypothetical protein